MPYRAWPNMKALVERLQASGLKVETRIEWGGGSGSCYVLCAKLLPLEPGKVFNYHADSEGELLGLIQESYPSFDVAAKVMARDWRVVFFLKESYDVNKEAARCLSAEKK